MKKSNIIYYWFALFAICFISYQQVQDTIRPGYTGGNLTIIYLLGIAPNFFPAVGIPALFFILIPVISKNSNGSKWVNENRHLTANLISLTGLLSWEFIQIKTAKGHFDWHDVLWTIIGAAVFHVIWKVTPDTYKVLQNEVK
jgi:hypothetical protein